MGRSSRNSHLVNYSRLTQSRIAILIFTVLISVPLYCKADNGDEEESLVPVNPEWQTSKMKVLWDDNKKSLPVADQKVGHAMLTSKKLKGYCAFPVNPFTKNSQIVFHRRIVLAEAFNKYSQSKFVLIFHHPNYLDEIFTYESSEVKGVPPGEYRIFCRFINEKDIKVLKPIPDSVKRRPSVKPNSKHLVNQDTSPLRKTNLKYDTISGLKPNFIDGTISDWISETTFSPAIEPGEFLLGPVDTCKRDTADLNSNDSTVKRSADSFDSIGIREHLPLTVCTSVVCFVGLVAGFLFAGFQLKSMRRSQSKPCSCETGKPFSSKAVANSKARAYGQKNNESAYIVNSPAAIFKSTQGIVALQFKRKPRESPPLRL
eukprot:GHVT01096637.1.p1 GENE.GHVT01096637.1~~GHVT01096637.1.p1  ORF type:complete len:373 (-),score=8.52 GHVT01096637.1:62-1180(-)